ncbi:MAG: hypothetical protein A3F14_03685 [Gammaproteobacteria bacterium RIFCSPHIGHO2_12_FULL_43_28]|nr:MAG: hypothetical protein A3F14_03685 [Gammaproteobacteria bacterium RIFCSPHIGHO2_12_FULL_43_28]
MAFVRYCLIISCAAFLASCSYLGKIPGVGGREKEYLAARSVPPIQIPPGLTSDAFQTAYPVSYRQYPESAKNVSIVPPGLASGK